MQKIVGRVGNLDTVSLTKLIADLSWTSHGIGWIIPSQEYERMFIKVLVPKLIKI